MELTIQMPLEAALPNVQERKLDQLRKKGLKTVEDLLRYFPRRYEDRSVVLRDFTDLKSHVDQKLAVEGRLKEKRTYGPCKVDSRRYRATLRESRIKCNDQFREERTPEDESRVEVC